MASNGCNLYEDTEMAERDGEKVVTMMDVLQEQQDFEEDANAVLGASDEKNCTFPKGYIKRQALYACLTCCNDLKNDPEKRAGVCLACSLACHENHELVELYTKRNFRCDCGNPKFESHPCQFTPNKTELNDENSYNQNFSGLYCVCHRPYPDPEASEEDEMIQCIICEDWLHTSHLDATVPANDMYSEMICKGCMKQNEFLNNYTNYAVNTEDIELNVTDVLSGSVIENDSVLNNIGEENVVKEVNKELEIETINRNAETIVDPVVTSVSVDKVIDDITDEPSADTSTTLNDEEAKISQEENKESEITSVVPDSTADQEIMSKTQIESNSPEQKSKDENTEAIIDATPEVTSDLQDKNETLENNTTQENDTQAAKEQTSDVDTKINENSEENKDIQSCEESTESHVDGVNDEPASDSISENIDKEKMDETGTAEADTTSMVEQKEENESSANTISANDTDNKEKSEVNDIDTEKKPDDTENIESTNDVEMADSIQDSDNTNIVSGSEETVNESKRKLSTEEVEEESAKKPKLISDCSKPLEKKAFKGATFWPSTFRQKLCTCRECLAMYKDLSVLFLIDSEDTVTAYEALGKERINGNPVSQYEKGLEALSSLDRIQQINALTEYNRMRDKLLDFLKSFKERKEVVKEEDIKAFFAGMKPKREPDGVYFCR